MTEVCSIPITGHRFECVVYPAFLANKKKKSPVEKTIIFFVAVTRLHLWKQRIFRQFALLSCHWKAFQICTFKFPKSTIINMVNAQLCEAEITEACTFAPSNYVR